MNCAIASNNLRGGSSVEIIMDAIKEYLEKLNRSEFLEEARRQSVLASTSSNEDEEVWLGHADGWK